MDDLLDFNFYDKSTPSNQNNYSNNNSRTPSYSLPAPVAQKKNAQIPLKASKPEDPFANLFQKKTDNKISLKELERQKVGTPDSNSTPKSSNYDPFENLEILHQLSNTPRDKDAVIHDKIEENKRPISQPQVSASEKVTLEDLSLEPHQPVSLPAFENIGSETSIPFENHNEITNMNTAKDNSSSNEMYEKLRDLGFSDDQSRLALENSESLEDAIEYILEKDNAKGQYREGEAYEAFSDSSAKTQFSDFQALSNQLKSQLFEKANDLWNIGRKKLRDAVEERRAVKDPSKPRWMDASHDFGREATPEILPKTPIPKRKPHKVPMNEKVSEDRITTNQSRSGNDESSLVDFLTSKSDNSSFNFPSDTYEGTENILETAYESTTARQVNNNKPGKSTVKKREEETLNNMVSTLVEEQQSTGNELFRKGDFSQAIEEFTNSLSQLPAKHTKRVPLLSNRSLCYQKVGDLKTCLQDVDELVDIIGEEKGHGESIRDKSMNDYYVKNMVRKAQVLEQLEKYQESLNIWKDLIADGQISKLYIDGKHRCEAAISSHSSESHSKRTTQQPKSTPNHTNIEVKSERLQHVRMAQQKAEQLDEERSRLREPVQQIVNKWKEGKESNLRALLASLDTILWPECRWQKVSLSELVLPKKVKIAYMKAVSRVHPDKLPQQTTVEHQLIAESAFSILNHAWELFKQQNDL
ncbi:UBA/TPR/DNAJ domain-containing protein Ucp7 [Schizosaccharomyces pombe]